MPAEIIAISTQKGGVGKSLLSISLASALHWHYGKNVLFLDADYVQKTSSQFRDENLHRLKTNQDLANKYMALGKPAYVIRTCPINEIIASAKLYEDKVDVIIIDTPGTLLEENILKVLPFINYVFVPFEADKGTVQSSMDYLVQLMKENKKGGSQLKGYYAFWNSYQSTIKQNIFQEVEAIWEKHQIPFLKTRVDRREIYKSDKCRNTVFPYGPEIKGMAMAEFIEEVYQMIFK
jgi:cellulose biosynthesis protein BcsQ